MVLSEIVWYTVWCTMILSEIVWYTVWCTMVLSEIVWYTVWCTMVSGWSSRLIHHVDPTAVIAKSIWFTSHESNNHTWHSLAHTSHYPNKIRIKEAIKNLE